MMRTVASDVPNQGAGNRATPVPPWFASGSLCRVA